MKIKCNLYVIFFFSGFTALTYQVIWNRYLARVLGGTAYASATTIAAFMLGLAAGSLISGKSSVQQKRPLKVYALLELFLGIYAMLYPLIMNHLDHVYYAGYPFFSQNYGRLLTFRFLLSVSTLILPALAMGATLPLVGRFLSRLSGSFENNLAVLYGINTAGAAAGCLTAGFLFIPFLGMTKSLLVSALINFLISGAALRLSNAEMRTEVRINPSSNPNPPFSCMSHPLLAISLFAGGFAFMLLEIALIRALSLCFGSSVCAFSMTVSVFIISLAFGSFMAQRLLATNRDLYKILHVILLMTGIAVLLTVMLVTSIPGLVMQLFLIFMKADYRLFLLWQAMLSVIALFLPAFLAGHIFPLTVGVYHRSNAEPGSCIGSLYALNTAGDVAGSLCAGFLILPFLGMQKSIYLSAFLFLLCAAVLAFRSGKSAWYPLLIFLPLLLIFFTPKWDFTFFNSAVFYRPGRFVNLKRGLSADGKSSLPSLGAAVDAPVILYQKEGVEAFINVLEKKGVRSLAINGKVDASDGADMITQRLLGHVPCFLHPSPENVLVIGWGSGVTGWCASLHNPRSIDAVEICREVVEASKLFRHVNGDILNDPRLSMHIDDGRNFLAGSRKRFDVIISEPTNLWIAGIGSLFSREFFQLAGSRLNPGGLICQWIHCYEISEIDFKTVIRTFTSVFPDSRAFRVNDSDVLLIGHKGPVASLSRIAERFSGPAGIDAQKDGINGIRGLLDLELSSNQDLAAYAGPGEFNTDDNALVEFRAPYSLFLPDQKLIEKLSSHPHGHERLIDLLPETDIR
ncbi:MAG: fused MFS/spermidine synthase [Candidatus Wallbacteria bacterium]|nr:fused MFS/spermidine synthase [Candidatus Wallbacteria bacterium]